MADSKESCHSAILDEGEGNILGTKAPVLSLPKRSKSKSMTAFPLPLSNLAAQRVENPLLVSAPERCDKKPLGAVAGEPVDDRLRRQEPQAVNN